MQHGSAAAELTEVSDRQFRVHEGSWRLGPEQHPLPTPEIAATLVTRVLRSVDECDRRSGLVQ